MWHLSTGPPGKAWPGRLLLRSWAKSGQRWYAATVKKDVPPRWNRRRYSGMGTRVPSNPCERNGVQSTPYVTAGITNVI